MPSRVFSNKLAIRLSVVLTLALVPLGAIAIYSEYEVWQRQKASVEAGLLSRTSSTVRGQGALLGSAMDAARRIAPNVLDLAGDPVLCSQYLAEYIAESRLYAFAGFITPDGQMTCASEGEGYDFSGSEDLERMIENPRRNFSFQALGSVTRQPVVLANYPVLRDEELRGILSISISQATFQLISTPNDPESGLSKVVLVNGNGQTLTADGTRDTPAMLPEPEQIARFIPHREGIFFAPSQSGTERVFTFTQLLPGQLYALGSWSSDLTRAGLTPDIWRIAFPVLMWIASVGALIMAAHYLVVRHLRHINMQLRRFALGTRAEFQRLPDDAPAELREIDSTFSKMARLIRRDEIEREAALQEKTILLKEVHHRVKNNLQLIASILNLQMRRLNDPQARAILKGVQTRVRALASIHRTLYADTGVSNVDATVFLEGILRDNLALAGSQTPALDIDSQLDQVAIAPDKIIPMALLFSEALTNALKYCTEAGTDGKRKLSIRLQKSGSGAELYVYNSCKPLAESTVETGLGSELMTAFALQIGAELDVGAVTGPDGPGWQMRLRLGDTRADADVTVAETTREGP